jgi:hypothetical protein
MQLTPRYFLLQFAHSLQQSMFALEPDLGPVPSQLELLAAIMSMAPLERLLSARRAVTGRPAKDRAALATAFIAKAILNLGTTRDLIARLKVDEPLRRLCGWSSASKLPHEAKFSRAFTEFAATELPQQLHAAVIELTLKDQLMGHVAHDATAIPLRERYPDSAKATKQAKLKKKGKKSRKGKHARAKAAERGTRIQRQRHQTLEKMLDELPRNCDCGAKIGSQGFKDGWRGVKLHLSVADGQIPVGAVLTSASVHDSQVAIPLMEITSRRIRYCYDLLDSAYDAEAIHGYSLHLNHVPIIAPHSRRATTKKPIELQEVFPGKLMPQLSPAQAERYKLRTMSERVNARLKDEFGARQIRVRGAVKVMAHLMFGVLALTVDQWLRLAAPS